jgi:hypothetical protein
MDNLDFWRKRISRSAVLDPVDRTAEVLFGLIMVLTFTGAISVSSDGREEIRSLLWAALGCNVAWGLVDAIMYLMNVLFERGYSRKMFLKMKNTEQGTASLQMIRNELPPLLSELMNDRQIKELEANFRKLPEVPVAALLTRSDFWMAVKIFFLVFICTLPVALPFVFISEPLTALRVSNGVALLMLFLGGYNMARFAGFRRVLTAFVYMLIGVVLVGMTMALGG